MILGLQSEYQTCYLDRYKADFLYLNSKFYQIFTICIKRCGKPHLYNALFLRIIQRKRNIRALSGGTE